MDYKERIKEMLELLTKRQLEMIFQAINEMLR